MGRSTKALLYWTRGCLVLFWGTWIGGFLTIALEWDWLLTASLFLASILSLGAVMKLVRRRQRLEDPRSNESNWDTAVVMVLLGLMPCLFTNAPGLITDPKPSDIQWITYLTVLLLFGGCALAINSGKLSKRKPSAGSQA